MALFGMLPPPLLMTDALACTFQLVIPQPDGGPTVRPSDVVFIWYELPTQDDVPKGTLFTLTVGGFVVPVVTRTGTVEGKFTSPSPASVRDAVTFTLNGPPAAWEHGAATEIGKVPAVSNAAFASVEIETTMDPDDELAPLAVIVHPAGAVMVSESPKIVSPAKSMPAKPVIRQENERVPPGRMD